MFSYVINNPNNFVIKNDYFIIPFGHRCSSALACKFANIRKFSLPFDWGNPFFPQTIKKILKNNFDGFTDFTCTGRNTINAKYNFGYSHFDSNIVETLKRRIIRFNDIINQTKKIYFVYINDDYLYDNNYRQDEFNDKIFNEMLELENFLKDKYKNIDYNILYFNFKHHNIPTNSNIINIVLNSTNLYDDHEISPFKLFRNYCGKVLSELFNTNLTLDYVYDPNTFNN
jgi:hypothetical protein